MILIGLLLFLGIFYILYKHQLGSIGFFLLSLLFFRLAKNKQASQKGTTKRKETFYFKEKLNKP
ncbi:hypothetical protein A499_09259 [Niallia nealsonii AAU1]|nr:hypothetical protein A499_09259 [Niallia nealsonii AAU1]